MSNPFDVGDQVMLREDVLQRHSRTVPASAGYTHEQFQWRDTLRALKGKVGVVERLFPNSRHVNVQFDGNVIGLDYTELVGMPTVVLFRMDNIGPQDERAVFALFPELPGDNESWTCTCYQHIGQHCSADFAGCIRHSRPATPEEYKDLTAELTGRGYNLDIRKKASSKMHAKRRTELAR